MRAYEWCVYGYDTAPFAGERSASHMGITDSESAARAHVVSILHEGGSAMGVVRLVSLEIGLLPSLSLAWAPIAEQLCVRTVRGGCLWVSVPVVTSSNHAAARSQGEKGVFAHEEQTAWLREMFPDWDIWQTQKTTLKSRDESWCSWHARPHGALVAVFHDDCPNRLAAMILAYVDNLADHIAVALTRELQALRDLQSPESEKF